MVLVSLSTSRRVLGRACLECGVCCVLVAACLPVWFSADTGSVLGLKFAV